MPLAARAPVRPESPAFSDFAIRPEIVSALAGGGHHPHLRDPGIDAADRAGRQRPDRPGPYRHRQDAGLRRSAAQPARTCPVARAPRRRRSWSRRPASSPCRSPATSPPPASNSARACVTIYGGRAYEPQIEALRKRGVDVVVGTPGRLLDLVAAGAPASSARCSILVLDEADEMLDLGFLPDIEKLLAAAARTAPDHAVLGHDARARSSRWPASSSPSPSRSAPSTAPTTRPRPSTSTSSPTAPTRWTRPSCWPGCCRRAGAA